MQKYDYGTRYLVKDVDARIAELEEALRKIAESKVYCNPLKDIARKALKDD